MNHDNTRAFVGLAVLTVAAGVAVKHHINVTKEERAKRQEIDRNMHLDLLAIKRASEVIKKQIEDGHIRSLSELGAATNSEIEFQKIAVREDH